MEILILSIILIAFFMWLGWRLRLWWKNILFSRSRKRGRQGEAEALKILKRYGYKIIQSQLSLPGHIFIDDDKQDFDVRPDYLVEKGGVQYLAEVKTGKAARSASRETRRQLFEYAALGNSDTVILVDATKGTLNKIRFEQMY
jgi:hypothetical protein